MGKSWKCQGSLHNRWMKSLPALSLSISWSSEISTSITEKAIYSLRQRGRANLRKSQFLFMGKHTSSVCVGCGCPRLHRGRRGFETDRSHSDQIEFTAGASLNALNSSLVVRPPWRLLEIDVWVRDDDGHEVGEADAREDARHDGGGAEHAGGGGVLGLNTPERERPFLYDVHSLYFMFNLLLFSLNLCTTFH